MYKILVVDDEPRVSTGIKNYLLRSELEISLVETALNGFEALDYLRMDTFDLILTDIQMSLMNGIELMEAIYMEQPHLPIIVISAHEKFDFAKKSLRLGARDYLIKPVELDELIRVVGRVLQEKGETGRQLLEHSARTDRGESLATKRKKALIELITETDLQQSDYSDLLQELDAHEKETHYGMMTVHFDLSRVGFSSRGITLRDRKLLKYASVNIMEESLADWKGIAFYGLGNQLIAAFQLNAQEVSDQRVHLKSQLNLIGQLIYINLKQFLNVEAIVGMSTLTTDISALPKLLGEASAASEWSSLHPSNKVFYFEDMSGPGRMNYIDWVTKVNQFVDQLKLMGGEPPPEDTESIVRLLSELGRSEEMFNSCFGLLVYRLYGLLLECGQDSGLPLRRYDPDIYFRGTPIDHKTERLGEYIPELSLLLRKCLIERDQSIISQVAGYIHKHYGNRGLKVQDIAGEVHFSAAYVGYLFKKIMKTNLWEYVTMVRIEEAKRLLEMTDKRRYEIAYQVGYESPEHFSRIFKRCVGISPAEYRKERQEEAG
ncbi:response regulator [Paenibacillus sepulcri]|uniref:Response regulator n=1 Tax=Paenibacillus sepulcri TaxID=359917 RepID=A0ABS7BXA9_9BACL|nr:response regulator [Paenibacillus sepulcri]